MIRMFGFTLLGLGITAADDRSAVSIMVLSQSPRRKLGKRSLPPLYPLELLLCSRPDSARNGQRLLVCILRTTSETEYATRL
jgi:hypothetical protein